MHVMFLKANTGKVLAYFFGKAVSPMKHFPQGPGDIMWPRKIQSVGLALAGAGPFGHHRHHHKATTCEGQIKLVPTRTTQAGLHGSQSCFFLSISGRRWLVARLWQHLSKAHEYGVLRTILTFRVALFFNRAVQNWSCFPSGQRSHRQHLSSR